VDLYLPGFRAANDLVLNHPMFPANPPMVGAWIGNRTTALAHHDMSHNVACVAVGRRRFTLFPPEQVENLYPGPLEPTPGRAGRDHDGHQRTGFRAFPEATRSARGGAGGRDAARRRAVLPALWWHQVDALESFNVMINYWWNTSPAWMDTPQTTLLHALLSLARSFRAGEARLARDVRLLRLRPRRKAAAHLPETARGNLAPLDEDKARRLRAKLLERLNR
jgi:hypothetical protein